MTAPAGGSASGGRLHELRVALGVPMSALARSSGVGQRTLWRWEAEGLERAPVLLLVRVAWALGVAPASLVPALGLRPGPERMLSQARDQGGR